VAKGYADTLAAVWRGVSVNGITFRAPSLFPVGSLGNEGWYQINLDIPYYWDNPSSASGVSSPAASAAYVPPLVLRFDLHLDTQAVFPPAANQVYWDGTLTDINFAGFETTGISYRVGRFVVPSDVDVDENITFKIWGQREIAGSAAAVSILFEHLRLPLGSSMETAYGQSRSPAVTVAASTVTDISSWAVTFASLGWAAGDLITFRVARDQPHADDTLTGGKWLGHMFTISIPRSG
jgi:hypothetical protein